MTIRRRFRSAIHRIWPPRPRPLILMYHRIAEEPVDHWGLAVSPRLFEEQLQVLRRTRRPLPLEDFVRNLRQGTLSSDAVAVTFDDGYVDNLVSGKPRLAAADIPATVFLATGYLGRPGEFWWDELSRLILTGRSPRSFELAIGGGAMLVDMGADTAGNRSRSVSKTRRAALTAIWERMRRLDDDQRQLVMSAIRSIVADTDGHVDRGRAMTDEEVRNLVSDGLVSIGAHTVSHPLLTALGDVACGSEVAKSKSDCEDLIGSQVNGFAYPYGEFDASARSAVSTARFTFACSTRHAAAGSTSDILALPRVQICNWDGNTFQRVLHRWSAGD